MKKALITGISGFAGSHLADFLLAKGDTQVFGIVRKKDNPNIAHILGRINLYQGDIADYNFWESILKKEKFDLIFHLAASSSPRLSYNDPQGTLELNTFPQINLFEAILKLRFNPKVLVVGSSEEYGIVEKKHLPIKEDTPLKPVSPYGVSKVAQDFLAYSYFKTFDLKVVRVRPFNHIGPRQDSSFVVSSFARQIAQIEKGQKEPILKVGNLAARRDFTDVRDMVRAYALALGKGELGNVYNVGSGKSLSLKAVLDKLLTISGLKVRVVKDKKLFRPLDIPDFVGDPGKFRKKTGWSPRYSLDDTLKFTLEWWREVV